MIKKPSAETIRKLLLTVLVISFLYSIYGGFDGGAFNQETPPPKKQEKAHMPIETISLAAQEIRAQLLPLNYTTVSAEIAAKVKKIHLKEGSSFKKNDLLVSLDCDLEMAQLIKAKAAKEATERTYHANQRLFKLDVIGKIELDNSFSEAEKARGEFISISTTVTKCKITAPFDGKIGEQKVREEQFVQPGQAILDILDGKEMELEFLVPSKWLTWLNSSTVASIHIDETNKDYPITIKTIGAKTDAISQSIKVSATIESRYPELSPGMSGKINITVPEGQEN